MSNKAQAVILLYLSRIKDKIYVAVDGNTIDLKEFGIDTMKLGELSQEIDDAIQKVLGGKPNERHSEQTDL